MFVGAVERQIIDVAEGGVRNRFQLEFLGVGGVYARQYIGNQVVFAGDDR